MGNLIRAGLLRLKKSKLFWTFVILSLLWGALTYYLMWDSVEYYGEIYLNANAGFYFMMPLFYIGPAEAVFCAFFIGTDYSDGTIRNKILIGNRRKDLYLSNFILVSAAGFCFYLSYAAASVIVGLPLIGTGVFTAISALPWRLLSGALIVLTNAAIFTLLSMLNSNKAVTAVVGILLAVVIMVLGVFVYDALAQPEFIERQIFQDGWTEFVGEYVPNPRYVDGAAREALEWVSAAIPFSASLDTMSPSKDAISFKAPCCQFAVTVVLTVLGALLFERKNIN